MKGRQNGPNPEKEYQENLTPLQTVTHLQRLLSVIQRSSKGLHISSVPQPILGLIVLHNSILSLRTSAVFSSLGDVPLRGVPCPALTVVLPYSTLIVTLHTQWGDATQVFTAQFWKLKLNPEPLTTSSQPRRAARKG